MAVALSNRFKDDHILDADCEGTECKELSMESVQRGNSGRYKCRAVSSAGKRYSNEADVVISGRFSTLTQPG